MNKILEKMKPLIKKFRPIVNEFNIPDLFSRTAEMAFYLTISIFPSMIFIICAMAYIPDVNLAKMQISLSQLIPHQAFMIVKVLINSAVENRSLHLLVLSFLLATWTFSKAVKSMIKGQNMAFGFKEKRSFIKLNVICITYAIGFFIVTLLCIAFIVYGDKLSLLFQKVFGDFIILNILYNIFRYLLPVTVMTYIFISLFTLGPSGELKFKECSPGAVTTTILWLIFSLIYSYYANYFFRSKEIYGSISSIIILLTWLYFCGMSITIGYKLNAILYHSRLKKKKSRVL